MHNILIFRPISPLGYTTDLLELALEDWAARQQAECQRIASYAPALTGIEATLDALRAAGLLLLPQSVQVMPPDMPPEIMVSALAAAGLRKAADRRLEEARLTLQADGGSTPVTVWQHADGWLLSIIWVESPPVHTAADPQGVPA